MAIGRPSTVQVTFKVDGDGNVRAAFGGLATEADKSATSLRNLDTAADDAEKSQARLLTSAKLAGAALGGALVGGIGLVIRNTIQAQQEQAQLEAVLRSTGNAAGYSAKELNAMAGALSNASVFSAGEINEAQTRLLSYSGVVGEQVPRAMQIIIDQGQRLGISLTQSAEIVGRALESPTKAAAALAQQGFGAAFDESVRKSIQELEDAGKVADAQAIVMTILEESYAGAAEAARDTLGGALAALQNSFEDLMTGEGGGAGVVGATEAINDLVDLMNSPEAKIAFGEMVEGLIEVATFATRAMIAVQGLYAEQMKSLGLTSEPKGGTRNAGFGDVVGGIASGWQALLSGDLDSARAGARRAQAGTAGALFGGTWYNDGRVADFSNVVNGSAFDNVTNGTEGKPTGDRPPNPDEEDAEAAAEARRRAAAAAREQAAAERELAKAQREAQEAQNAFVRDQDEALAVLEDLRAEMAGPAAEAALAYARAQRELDEVVGAGLITWAQYAEGMELLHQQNQKNLAELAPKVEETANAMTVFADQAARNMQDAFADFLFDPFQDGLSGMLQGFSEILQRMYAEYLASELFKSVMGGGTDASGNVMGGILDLFAGSWGFAKGGAIAGSPSLSAYSGTVVDRPTAFMFAKGGAVGVMGEVPGESEGIFPLKRGRDGRLGVAAEISGGGGGTVVEVHNYSGEQARTERGSTPDGRDLIRVFVGEAARDIASGGPLSGAIAGTFGLRRQGTHSG